MLTNNNNNSKFNFKIQKIPKITIIKMQFNKMKIPKSNYNNNNNQ